MNYRIKSIFAAVAMLGCCSAFAAVSAEEAKQLGTTLTPWGAEKAGNKDGTITAYQPLAAPPASYNPAKPGILPDPFANEKPLLSIDAKNMAQHADKLTEGVKAMLAKYPTFRVDVYPTHRISPYPKSVQDASIANGTNCKLVGENIEGCGAGLPFPIPKNGEEAMYNKLMGFQGIAYLERSGSYLVDASGKVTLMAFNDFYNDPTVYSQPNLKNNKERLFFNIRVDTDEPARAAGERLLMKCPIDLSDGCKFWQYLPGQRRVKLSPDLAYDTPNPQSGGSSGMDDAHGFLGRLDRFDFKLIGKKEMFIPVNSYKLAAQEGECADEAKVILKNHLNPNCTRWELRRTWVVEGTLKAGKRHIYAKRILYMDEDSYNAGVYDNYDSAGKIYRVALEFGIPGYNDKSLGTFAQFYMTADLQTGVYGFFHYPSAKYGGYFPIPVKAPAREFTPEALGGGGVR
jgi:hypothetical protein